MAESSVDLDLYADVEEFPQEELERETNDLYDDVLAASSNDKETQAKKEAEATPTTITSPAINRKYQLYVGNLTWWTTDQDIQDAVQSLAITDFIEVKFYENRANGQSKGFCNVSVGSESSMKTLIEKMPKKELHGQAPVVTYATKQALVQFESQSKTRPPQQGQSQGMGRGMTSPMGGPPRMMGPRPPMGGHMRGPPPAGAFSRPPPGIRPPMMRGPPPGMAPISGPPLGLPPPIMTGPPPRALPPGLPAPHVNPAFFTGAHGLSEAEFEEIMSRNRTVSSSAIARAVQDAASGEYASAIETLVTAMSLIKQSKVAGDDRCKILISSLQDTLHGIENKSYGGRSHSHHRGERSRSRDRHRGREDLYSRRRSYSREREYRERPREEHREYYRERSRSRDRDREREYREREKYYEERARYKERMREDGRVKSERYGDERIKTERFE